MFGKGFLGTRADFLFDLIICSLLAILPVLYFSYRSAKKRKFALHRNTQLLLTLILAVVIFLFEMDLQQKGGIFEMTRGSSFSGTRFMTASIYLHMTFSFSTAFLWLALLILSMIKFPNPPRPNAFSRFHKFWGRIALWDMVMTGLTGFGLYLLGFVF